MFDDFSPVMEVCIVSALAVNMSVKIRDAISNTDHVHHRLQITPSNVILTSYFNCLIQDVEEGGGGKEDTRWYTKG